METTSVVDTQQLLTFSRRHFILSFSSAICQTVVSEVMAGQKSVNTSSFAT